MRTLLLLGSLVLTGSGCTYFEQLQPTFGQSLTPTVGRAYFLKRTIGGTRVLVCDVRPADNTVSCYDSNQGGQ